MTHPYWYFHNVEQNINEAFDLLHDVNDNKTRVIKILSELKQLIKKQREDFNEFETKKMHFRSKAPLRLGFDLLCLIMIRTSFGGLNNFFQVYLLTRQFFRCFRHCCLLRSQRL